LRHANLTQSTFTHAVLFSVDMFRAIAKNCSFRHASLVRADLREGDFSNSDFNEATLVDANLERASFQCAKLVTCDLDGAVRTNTNF
jgi:uncharacterized protein YjbI with pentapeptide repeats